MVSSKRTHPPQTSRYFPPFAEIAPSSARSPGNSESLRVVAWWTKIHASPWKAYSWDQPDHQRGPEVLRQNALEIPTIPRRALRLSTIIFPQNHCSDIAGCMCTKYAGLLESGLRKDASRTQFRGLSGIITPFLLKKSWRSTDSHLKTGDFSATASQPGASTGRPSNTYHISTLFLFI